MMTKARESGQCPWEFIADRSRPIYMPQVFSSVASYARVIEHSYRKDLWLTQPTKKSDPRSLEFAARYGTAAANSLKQSAK